MTLGHEDLMKRASRLFDRLILAVAAGHHKRTMFTIAERRGRSPARSPRPTENVEVMAFPRPAARLRGGQGGKVVIRGLRAVSDFEYEFQMAGMNRQLMPDVETVFMTPSATSTSSSAAPSCARLPASAVMFPSSWHPRCFVA